MKPRYARIATVAMTVLAALQWACWVPDPLFCRQDSDCWDLGPGQICDETGEYAESNHVARTCTVLNPDAGPVVDAGADASVPVPGFVRIFHEGPATGGPALYAADVNDGVLSSAVPVSASTGNVDAKVRDVQAVGDVVIYTEGLSDAAAVYMVRMLSSGPQQSVRISHGESECVGFSLLLPDVSGAIFGCADTATSGTYRVDLSGAVPGAPVRIGDGVSSTRSNPVILSKDGKKLYFVRNQVLYVADVSGDVPSVPVRLSREAVEGLSLAGPVLSSTGDRVAYVSNARDLDVYELFVVDVSGPVPGAPERASAPLARGDVMQFYPWPGFDFSPDGQQLAYLASTHGVELNELYIVNVSGVSPGPALKVNDVLVAGGAVENDPYGTRPFQFSPDSKRIAYTATQRFDDIIELFIVDLAGARPGPAIRVSGTMAPERAVEFMQFAPDSRGLAYVADERTDDVLELFFSSLRGDLPSAPQVVNGDLVAGGVVELRGNHPTVLSFSNDGRYLAYVADQNVRGRKELFISDVSIGVPTVAQILQSSSVADSSIGWAEFSSDSKSLVWSRKVGDAEDIWVTDIRGPISEAAKVNSSGPSGDFWLAP